MKILLALVLPICFVSIADAQHIKLALERVSAINFLLDGRDEAVGKLREFSEVHSGDRSDVLSLGDTQIEIFYSSGDCDEDEREVWSVDQGRVVEVAITDEKRPSPESIELKLAALTKEQIFAGNKNKHIYHSKAEGIAVVIHDGQIERLMIFPKTPQKAKPCNTEFAREFISYKSWFGSTPLNGREENPGHGPVNVDRLEVSTNLIEGSMPRIVSVRAVAVDPELDPLSFIYNVSAGKIIGTGSEVKWDLTNAGLGDHTITVYVDDGCGRCGSSQTQTVRIK